MKQILFSLLCLMLAVSCTGASKSDSATTSEQAEEQAVAVQNVTQNQTSSVAESDSMIKGAPTIIDFSATWCGPCRQFAPIFEQAEKDYKGKVNFVKIDVDEQQALATGYGIESIPTIIFLDSNGKEVKRMIGLPEESKFRGMIDALLAK